MHFQRHAFRAGEKHNLGKNKRKPSNNVSGGKRNDYSQILRFCVTEFVKRINRVIVFGVGERREGKDRLWPSQGSE